MNFSKKSSNENYNETETETFLVTETIFKIGDVVFAFAVEKDNLLEQGKRNKHKFFFMDTLFVIIAFFFFAKKL
jgi:hypothetical protein